MSLKQLLIFAVVSAICASTVAGLKKDKYYCEKSSPCKCISSNDNNIDLTGLSLSMNITTGVQLHYQPCPSAENNSTSAVIIVKSTSENTSNSTINNTSITVPIAFYDDVQFEIGDAVMLVYENKTNKFEVVLSCDLNGQEYLTNYRNNTANHSVITLKTSKVCGLNLKDAIENSSDLWSTFFSIFLFIAFIYFVCGSIVNACLFNELSVNMIPHYGFWSSLCNNIKGKLCGTSMMASTYESI